MKKGTKSSGIKLPGLTFLNEVKTEVTKITWPSRTQVVRMSAIVIFVSAATGAYLGALDYLFVRLVSFLVNN